MKFQLIILYTKMLIKTIEKTFLTVYKCKAKHSQSNYVKQSIMLLTELSIARPVYHLCREIDILYDIFF